MSAYPMDSSDALLSIETISAAADEKRCRRDPARATTTSSSMPTPTQPTSSATAGAGRGGRLAIRATSQLPPAPEQGAGGGGRMIDSLLLVALCVVLVRGNFDGAALVNDALDPHDLGMEVAEAVGDEQGDIPDEANSAEVARMGVTFPGAACLLNPPGVSYFAGPTNRQGNRWGN